MWRVNVPHGIPIGKLRDAALMRYAREVRVVNRRIGRFEVAEQVAAVLLADLLLMALAMLQLGLPLVITVPAQKPQRVLQSRRLQWPIVAVALLDRLVGEYGVVLEQLQAWVDAMVRIERSYGRLVLGYTALVEAVA